MESDYGELTIGCYNFNKESFQYVEKSIIQTWSENKADYIVLDEIGPVEIRKNLGFHELLMHLQDTIEKAHPNLLLVVRDYCLEEFISKYKFNNLEVMTLNNFNKI